MIGKICFAIANKNVEIVVENSKIVKHNIKTVQKENQFTKISYFNSDNSDMRDDEYEQFYDENSELVELLADLEVLF
jgi:NAD-dependent DNA ligase